MRALVLGGTGPTGPFIVDGLLARGFEVAVMHSGQHEAEFAGPVEHIHGDVHFEETLREALGSREFDVTIAAYGRLKLTADVMVGRTGRLISIGSSAMALYEQPQWGPSGKLSAIEPDSPKVPDPHKDRFFYLIYQAEQDVIEHHRAKHYIATHLRYPYLYGPRQPATADWCIVRRILDGRRKLVIADDGLKLHSRACGENAGHAVLLAVDRPEISGGKIYNVADERVMTHRQRIDLIASALNHEWELVSMPYEWAKPFHPFARGRENWVMDISRTQSELGYHDVVPAEEAVIRAARYLAENPPERGGELETQLDDPYDYASEDALIAAFEEAKKLVMAVPFKDHVPTHMYRHPKQPNETWKKPASTTGFHLR